jgi:DnaK suppressor protein
LRDYPHTPGEARRNDQIALRLRARRAELLSGYDHCAAELHTTTDADLDEEELAERACSSAAEILSHLSAEIRDIDEALERLRHGDYGLCVDCGALIPAKRLRAVPTARRCLNCQARCERRAG